MQRTELQKFYSLINEYNKCFPLLNLKIINGMANEKFRNTEFEFLESNSEHICCGTQDYTRFRQAELIAEEIKYNKLSGAIAELGVYQGDFAQLINRLYPQKTFYLFDTFEGFNKHQIDDEIQNNLVKDSFIERIEMYVNTTTDKVMKRMQYPQNCRIYKGNFPDTASDIEEQFCFVSIDADFYQVTLDGLRFFYPKMVNGGYIMIHDYNDDELFGVKKALRDFKQLEPALKYIPITDSFGSVIIIK